MSEPPLAERTEPSSAERIESLSSRWHLIDVVFGLIVVATAAYYFRLMRSGIFSEDDWTFLELGRSRHGYVRPFHEHLSIVPIGMYHLLAVTFGLHSYIPFAATVIVSGAGIAVVVYLLVRSRVGAGIALAAGVTMLWYPQFTLVVSLFNHLLAFIAIALCAWILQVDRPKWDVVLALILGFGLASSGVAIAGVVGCGAYLLLTWAPWRRWLAVIVPSAAWVAWALANAGSPLNHPGPQQSFPPGAVFQGMLSSFNGLMFGNKTLGTILAVCFVANLVRVLRKGPRNASHELSWTAAFLVWWIGLGLSRGHKEVISLVFRYQAIGSGFIVLALLPRKMPKWVATPKYRLAGIGVGSVMAVLVIVVNLPGIRLRADQKSIQFAAAKTALVYANTGPEIVPDSATIYLWQSGLHVGTYRRLVASYGIPGGTQPPSVDAQMLRTNQAHIRVAKTNVTSWCPIITHPFSVAGPHVSKKVPPAIPGVRYISRGITAGDTPVTVKVRMVETRWINIGTIQPRTLSWMTLPTVPINRPWQVSAIGGRSCVVSP